MAAENADVSPKIGDVAPGSSVACVMPLFQKEHTVTRAIASVTAQTYTNFELIVVDDGSTDNGPAIVRTLADRDPRIRLFTRMNGGPGAAKNTGLTMVSAPFVTFLDADDEWEAGFLQDAVTTLEREPDCDVYASAFRLGPSGVDRWDELRQHGVVEGVWRLTPEISDLELAHCLGVIHACSSLFRTSVVREFGGFYEAQGCNYGEDVYLWLQLMLHSSIFRSTRISGWYHLDSSDLGLTSDRRDIPLEPVFTQTDPIRLSCPDHLRPVLERWLTFHALGAIHVYIERGDRRRANYLMRAFPGTRRQTRLYVSAWLKMYVPGSRRLIAALRRRRQRFNLAQIGSDAVPHTDGPKSGRDGALPTLHRFWRS